jgi:hypothetical protein
LYRRRKPTVETCVDNTAKLRPQASVKALRAAGASQLLKPSSTTPQSYGRRNWSWTTAMYTTVKYMRGAAGIGMGTAIK